MALSEQEELEMLRLRKRKSMSTPKGAASPASASPSQPEVPPPQEAPPKPNIMSALGKVPGMGWLTGPVEAEANMVSGMVAKPVSDVMGLAAMGNDAIRGTSGDAGGFKDEVQRSLTYQPRTDAGRAMTEYNPLALVGKGVNWIGQKAQELTAPPESGTGREMLGAGIHEAINQAPQFLGAKGPAMGVAAGDAMKGLARDRMQSALKPTIASLRTGKAGKAVDTMLAEGLNVSPGGVEKMQGKIYDLNTAIAQRIQNSPAMIDKASVATRLDPVFKKFEKQVNSTDDIVAIQKAHDEFMNNPLLQGNDIPVALAQEMKQGTYKVLGDKSYGEVKSASTEAQKALARGLKEEIARAVPEVHSLNAEESAMLNALSVSERRVMMEANKNPFGLAWLTTNPVKFAGFMADRSGLFQSLIARMLNKGSQVAPDVGKLAPLGGVAVTQGAQGIPTPPQNQP